MKQIRTSKFSKILAYYLAIMMFLQVVQPMQMYALTSGPTQPEFSAFTPIGTSDMVDLASGDFNYNIPIMDVGGYPINLAYNSGVTMDQEASWVGLGWNLNIGQIERQVRGLPDDFMGDEVTYTTNLKPNKTVGFNFRVNGQLVGFENAGSIQGSAALTLQHNNYSGISATPSFGVSYQINNNVSVGANISSSATEGVTVNPSVTVSDKNKNNTDSNLGLSASFGLSYNSRQGLQNYNLSASSTAIGNFTKNISSGLLNGGTGTATFNFINNSYTPTIRNEFATRSGTFNASLGFHAWFFDGEVGVGGFFSTQKLKNKVVNESVYGYEYTDKASENDVLDFNRENDRSISKSTRVLPVTNYTYDVYNLQTQGLSGSFRPYQSQVGYVFDPNRSDDSKSASLGVEVQFGVGAHAGADIEYSTSDVSAGIWNTPVKNYFKSSSNQNLDYEKNYYKLSSDLTLDNEINLYTDKLASNKAMDFKLLDIRSLDNKYHIKGQLLPLDISDKIKRSEREKRNQSIQKITTKEAAGDVTIKINPNAKPHHTAGYKVVNDNGSTFVFGETVYNKIKNEVTFAVNKNVTPNSEGIISYSQNDASTSNSNGIDNYYNKISTKNFTNTYLLTAVLSTDYEDITGNGISDDDLGSYTKFVYKAYDDYKWRAPYYGASYTPGFNSDKNHKKASYTYGEKEVKYISRIETKTHVAIFELSPRKDGMGVNQELNLDKNITSNSLMYKIDRIKLYSKPEAQKANLLNDNPLDDAPLAPIKTAHFEYSYDLCKGIHNNNKQAPSGNEISNNHGKLTLKKVYFTYRNSNMGKYTPYIFDYDESNPDSNPNYDMKSFDVWGNYKKNNGTGVMLPNDIISSVEFPYVDQKSKTEADKNTSMWHLKKVKLPSGGEIFIETESDDYQYVQNKRAMQMFKVVGVTKGNENGSSSVTNKLFNSGNYGGNNEAKRLVIEVDQNYDGEDALFINKYIGEQIDKPIFFRFMLNMLNTGANNYDYVEGYFKIDKNAGFSFFEEIDATSGITKYYAGIPMQLTDMEGGVNGNKNVNPISKAGWYFGRQNMNKTVYGLNNDPSSENVFDVVNAIGGSLETMVEIFTGPNGRLRNNKLCAQKFIPEKSFIRLQNPSQKKLGGGSRVKSIKLSDKWDNMLSGDMTSTGTNLNSMEYGQVYDYSIDETGASSGVATYEPLGAKDNPLIEPFYDKGERLVAPKEISYTEKPFGASFFPSPTITYSKVTVKNLPRVIDDRVVKKHATGTVVTEFYTSKDFPTKTDFTEIKNGENLKTTAPNQVAGFLAGLLGLPIIDSNKMTISQGFTVETNDMNGKQKSQKIFDENNNLISGVDYHYNINGAELNNNLIVINEKGEVNNSLIGVNYDVINDFRQNISNTKLYGIKGNVSIDFWPPITFTATPTVIPSYASHNNELRIATTTKVVHKKGILIEKIAYDLGSKVSTKNLAWDASSGQVLLTETVNEYGDHYFSFNYPAYWMYEGMGLASNNIGIEGILKAELQPTDPTSSSAVTNRPYFKIKDLPVTTDLTKYFHLGDEIYSTTSGIQGSGSSISDTEIDENSTPLIGSKLWVVGFNVDKTGILLMDRNGNYINKCLDFEEIPFKIVRSGYRNLQSASMASITSMINPLKDIDNDGDIDFDFNAFQFSGSTPNPRIVNASAVVYNDFWRPQSEYNQPYYPEYDPNLAHDINLNGQIVHRDDNPIKIDGNLNYPYAVRVNPYVKNIKGDWRAEKSYAYLTGRNTSSSQINNPRNEGFYNKFNPFYQLDQNKKWIIDNTNWTYASSITKYSPYGVELENKDALNRYSSAQYGYNYILPMAVASNAKYEQIGFESFEEKVAINKHFGFNISNTDIATNNSHTGKKSIKIVNGDTKILSKNLTLNTQNLAKESCPTDNPSGGGSIECYHGFYPNNAGGSGFQLYQSIGHVTFDGTIASYEILSTNADVLINQMNGNTLNIGMSSMNPDTINDGDSIFAYVSVTVDGITRILLFSATARNCYGSGEVRCAWPMKLACDNQETILLNNN